MKLLGKTAFVSGASRGLGRSIALKLASQGVQILVHFRREREKAEAVVSEIEKQGGRASLFQADLCQMEAVKAMWKSIKAQRESLDFFIANAASTAFKPLMEVGEEHIQKTFDLVIKSFLIGVQEALPLMEGRGGAIVTISGMDTTRVCPFHGLLGSAKAALEMLTKYLAVELGEKQIYTYCLNPGFLSTDSTRYYLGEAFEEVVQNVKNKMAYKGAIDASSMADLVLFLCSPEARSLTGQVLVADGSGNALPNMM